MTYERLPEGLIALGLVLGGFMIVEVVAIITPPVRYPLGIGPTAALILTSLLLITVIVAVGFWLRRGVIDPERYPRIILWVVSGFGVMVLVFGFLTFVTRDPWLAKLAKLRWAATAGVGGGLLAGVFEARAIDRAVTAERKRVKTAALRQRNERLESFANVVSHDLRNPLNVASGHLELAQEEHDSEHLAKIEDAHDRMRALIADLLVLARKGESVGEYESVALSEVAQDTWAGVDTQGSTVNIEIDRTIRADASRLKQIFENLFRNAVEHGGDDVTVTVGELDGGFYVEDDGPGIPEADREDVFQVGHSTKDEGTGFGLAILKEIVEAHGWDITVTEGSEGGARFEITRVEVAE